MNQNKYIYASRFLITVLLLLKITFLSLGQKISGRLEVNGEGSACNILLLNVSDSTLIDGYTFLNGDFSVINESSKNVFLKLSGLNFKDTLIHIKYSSESVDLGVIAIESNILQEAIITAKVPMLKSKGGKRIINVKRTSLSEAGTIKDILRRTPGLIERGEGIEVIGKGVPVIYIDGRKVVNQEELEMINSSEIDKFIIDKMPSVAYEGNTNAVINIITSKNIEERLGGQFSNELKIKREVSDKTMFSTSLKKGIFSTQLAYSGLYSKERLYENSYSNNIQPNYILKNNSSYTTVTNGFSNAFYLRTNIDISKKMMLGVQYMGKFVNIEDETNKEQNIEMNSSLISRNIKQYSESKPNLHSLSINYKYKINDKSNLFITSDYATRSEEENAKQKEANLNSGSVLNTSTQSQSKYNVYTSSIEYTFSPVAEIESRLGAMYGNVYNHYESLSSNPIFDNQTILKDEVTGLYLSGQKAFENWEIDLGIRYETASTAVRAIEDTIWTFSDFLGSTNMIYLPNDKVEFVAGYSRKTSRPSFRELDPTVHYYDSLTYISGNPYVQPSYRNNYYLEVVYLGDYTLSLTYSDIKNQRAQTLLSGKDNPDVTLMYPINIKKSKEFLIEISGHKTFKNISINTVTGIQFPKIEIPYLDEIIENSKPSWSLSINGEYNLKKLFTLYSSFSYHSSAYYDLTYSRSFNNLRLGIVGKYLNNKLSVMIEGVDLLNGSNWNNWDTKYLNIESGSRGDYDSRGIRLRLTYKFNSKMNKVNFKQGNREVLERVD